MLSDQIYLLLINYQIYLLLINYQIFNVYYNSLDLNCQDKFSLDIAVNMP